MIQLIGEALFELGFQGIAEPFRNPERRHPVIAAMGVIVMGGVAGVLSVWLLPQRLFGVTGVPGLSLIVAPIANAAAMETLGRWLLTMTGRRTYITTWWAGGLFAFSVAMVRFLSIDPPAFVKP